MAAVAIPVGFGVLCAYQMLKQKIGIADAANVYIDVMRESVPVAVGMCFLFYVAGMFTLFFLGHFGGKVNRLLGMSPDPD